MTTDLAVRDESLPSVLMGETPDERVAMALSIANALSPIIDNKKFYVTISGRRHVLYEGWTTLGALVGVFPVTVWTRETQHGWEARVEARTRDGAVVGAAEAECSRDEATWEKRHSFALRSMAQTRAGSKALRMPLGFIVALAGYEATPAEEMTEADRPAGRMLPDPRWHPEPPGDAPNCEQCNAVMKWKFGDKDGKRWAAWVCPDYTRTKHRSVFVDVEERMTTQRADD